jgi:GDP-4-dehydro-6-deoxy-D-mannose reductase
VGNLTPRRDFTDVRDAVRAYVLLVSRAEPGRAYNVCSGQSHSIQECADILLALARVPLTLEQQPSRARALEILEQVGDPTRIYQTTGWQPQLPLQSSLSDLLDDWRQRIALNKEEM